MRLIVNFPKPFAGLEEALLANGCTLIRNVWDIDAASAREFDACLVDFCDAARRLRPLWRLSRTMRTRSVPLVAIDRDAPWYKGVRRRRLWALGLLRPIDIYASHSLQDARRFAGEILYLPNAARIADYNLRGSTLEGLRNPGVYRYDVSFLGNLDATRYPEHRNRVAALHQLRAELGREGLRLELFDSSGMPVDEQVGIIQASRINLNLGAAADDRGERSWGLAERCYGIPACGGFLLSDARRHAADDFRPGVEWADFGSPEECVAKVRYFLGHFAEARSIAEAAHRRVTQEHTYLHRALRLRLTIANWLEVRRKESNEAIPRKDDH